MIERKIFEGFSKGEAVLALTLFFISVIAMMYVYLSPDAKIGYLFCIIVIQFSGCLLFPLLISKLSNSSKGTFDLGCLANKIQQSRCLQPCCARGLDNVYENREAALPEIESAFKNHSDGEIKLIGVSLRDYFDRNKHYNKCIDFLTDKVKNKKATIFLKVLVCHLDETIPVSEEPINLGNRESIESFKSGSFITMTKSPEVINRKMADASTNIFSEIKETLARIKVINKKMEDGNAEGREFITLKKYIEAPYCTAIIFPDRLFYIPNLLNSSKTDLLTLEFKSGSEYYESVVANFECIWKNSVQ